MNWPAFSKEVELWKEPMLDKPLDILVAPTEVSKNTSYINFDLLRNAEHWTVKTLRMTNRQIDQSVQAPVSGEQFFDKN